MTPKIKRESEKEEYSPKKTQRPKERDDVLRIVPLGGMEEVGRNMTYLEYKDEIVIVDMGLQFPEEETPGIDYIIPNISSLEPKRKNIRAVIITHGHYDHIGAIPYLIGKLGNPTIYTAKLTKAIIEKRQEEFVNAPKLNVVSIEAGKKIKVGEYFDLEFLSVEHTIPDSAGVLIKTPIGNIAHFGDFRIDYSESGEAHGLEVIKRLGDMGIHTFMCDSTNAEEPGKTLSERIVEKNLEILFKSADGRIILTTFSSMLTRIAEIIKISEKIGRKVVLNGRSMKDNVQIAQTMGYIKAKKGTIISADEMHKHKDEKILIITTGAQGESGAGLMRIVNGEHKHIRVKEGDTIVFSSSVIPGNERSVQTLKDNLTRQGALVHQSNIIDIHASGHAPSEDLTLTVKLLRPKFFMPIYGYYYMRAANGKNAVKGGVGPENVRTFMDNGQVAELDATSFNITKETVPAHYIMVDGLGVGDVGEIVLRDRKVLAQEGMVVVIATIDRRNGRILKNPDIISRGFIYLKENQQLLDDIRNKIRNIVNRIPRHQPMDSDYLKTLFRDQVGQFIYSKTNRRPMILPVVIEI